MRVNGRWPMVFAAALALAVGCARADKSAHGGARIPVVRFVDQAASGERSALNHFASELYRRLGGRRPLRTAQLPSATIANETRYVLVGPPSRAESLKLASTVRADAETPLRVVLPDDFANSTRALVRVATRSAREWSPPVYATLPVTPAADGQPTIAISRGFSAGDSGAPAEEISFEAFGESAALSLHRTAPFHVPAAAELMFGTGILTGTTPSGAVTFTVTACVSGSCAEIFRDEVMSEPVTLARWRDHSVPLAALAGKDVSFEFRATTRDLVPDALVLPLWSNPTVYAPAGKRRPNVILVSLDTLRADHLPTHGYSRDTAPFLQETFGARGTVLDDCASAAASTPPGHMTIMTSLDPSVHLVRRGDETLDPSVATLAEVLRADGMTTAAVTEDGWLVQGHGFGRGFDSYVEDRAIDMASPQGAIERTLSASLAWIARYHDTPFFLFVHTYQVHDPYVPPAEYRDLFTDVGMPAPDSLRYDQEIRFTDDRLRWFFAELGKLIDMENTIVVVTSDHGEGFAEHGYTLHSAFLYEEILHVPCMFWGAGVPQGRRLAAPVGTIDLAPTIAQLTGAPIPRQFVGIDLTPLFGADDADLDARLRSRLLFSEAWGDFAVGEHRELTAIVAPVLAVRRDHLKVVRTATPDAVRYEAYDVRVDPGERNDLLSAPNNVDTSTAAVIATLRARLDDYRDRSKKAHARLLGVSVDALPPERPAGLVVAPDTENKLRALGYLE